MHTFLLSPPLRIFLNTGRLARSSLLLLVIIWWLAFAGISYAQPDSEKSGQKSFTSASALAKEDTDTKSNTSTFTITLAQRLTIADRPIEPEPKRLINSNKVTMQLLVRNETRGPFVDYDDYHKRALSSLPTNFVSWQISGHQSVKIFVPEDGDSKPGSRAVAAADLPQLLDAMPDSSYFKRIFILKTSNPEDEWVTQTDYSTAVPSGTPTKDKGFISAMSMTDGELSMYKTERTDHLRRDVLHEWSHALRYKFWNDALMTCFNQAVNLELPEWNPSIYATRNNGEQWAVFGEKMLGNSGEDFLETCDKAPLRSALWMSALHKCLLQVSPDTVCTSIDSYVQRQRYVDEFIVPKAVAKLRLDKVAGTTPFLRSQAANVLHYLETERSDENEH